MLSFLCVYHGLKFHVFDWQKSFCALHSLITAIMPKLSPILLLDIAQKFTHYSQYYA